MCFRLCRSLDSSESIQSEEDRFDFTPLKTATLSLHVSSDDVSTPSECGPCERGQESGVAEFWCENCLEGLCQQCYFYHGRMKTSQSHSTVSMDQYKESKSDKMTSSEKFTDKTNKDFCKENKSFESKENTSNSETSKENRDKTSVVTSTASSNSSTMTTGIATLALGSQAYNMVHSHKHHTGHHHSAHGNKAWPGSWGTHGQRAQHGHRGTLSHPSRSHGKRRR